MSAKARVNDQGRIVIPAEAREAAGIKPGSEVLVEVVGPGELRLRTKRRGVERAQALYSRYAAKDRDPVADLIAERRREAKKENG